MKKVLLLATALTTVTVKAQVTEGEDKLRAVNADSTLGWKRGGMINLGLSQISLTNWVSGGESSISTNGLVSLFAHKTTPKGLWENYVDMGYGILKQGDAGQVRKTDDRFELLSKYGQKINANWYYAGLLSFKTQFADGYNYPDVSNPISRLLAPGYLLGAVGVEYRAGEFNVFIAPFTSKNTFVIDNTLSSIGAFGVTPGEVFRTELGGYVRMSYKRDIMENITFQTRLDLFSNYLNNPQNIDISWETLLTMKVNKYISATLATHMIYDDDIKIGADTNNDGIDDSFAPRLQFKQILNIGFSYKF